MIYATSPSAYAKVKTSEFLVREVCSLNLPSQIALVYRNRLDCAATLRDTTCSTTTRQSGMRRGHCQPTQCIPNDSLPHVPSPSIVDGAVSSALIHRLPNHRNEVRPSQRGSVLYLRSMLDCLALQKELKPRLVTHCEGEE